MISKKEIIDYLMFYFTVIHRYKIGHSRVMSKDIAKQIISKLPKLKLVCRDGLINSNCNQIIIPISGNWKKYHNKNIKIYVEVIDEKGKIPRNGRV